MDKKLAEGLKSGKLKIVEKGAPLDDGVKIVGEIGVVLKDAKTGKVKMKQVTHNIITNVGDHFYAQRMAGEADLFTVAGIRLGTNAGAASAPLKTDTDMTTTTGSAAPGGDSNQAMDSGYPKSDDDDVDNPGSPGPDVVTWRASWTTAQGNNNDIATIDVPDNFTPTQSLCIANFAAKFNKTASDTLKVFVNHTANGV